MPKKKKVEPIEVPQPSEEVIAAAEVQPEEVSPAVKGEAKTSFDVLNSSGDCVRTYSVELHGEYAEKLAHQYAGKIGGLVR